MSQSKLASVIKGVRDIGPIIAAVATGVALYYENKSALKEIIGEQNILAQRIADHAQLDADFRRIGPNGFENIQVRLATDAQISAYLKANGHKDGNFYDSFFQLNPSLVRPNGR